eukprot:m.84520 g.84520  ORF g.84520 m.84520 type:complete len:228 (+) comp19724_c0_seq1:145-828(+)
MPTPYRPPSSRTFYPSIHLTHHGRWYHLAILRRPTGVGLATIDGWAKSRKRNSQLSIVSNALDVEKEAFATYRRSFHIPDRELPDAVRAQERLTALVEASRLLSLRDNLRMQHTADADVDELRQRHSVMCSLMGEAHKTMIAHPDTGSEGDFQRAVDDGLWTPFLIDPVDESRLFALSKNMVGSFDSSPAFKASAGATELAAKQVMSAVPLLPGIPISLFPDDMGSD